MCAFKDAYTTEVLGHYVSGRMDVSLVQNAFNNMMENHKGEFPKDLEVYCHSDQGSQYLSTSFKQLLNENDFIQCPEEETVKTMRLWNHSLGA